MGWREAKAEADKARLEASEVNKDFLSRKSSFGSTGRPNSLSIMGGVTGEDKLPEVEPERSWVKDWDNMALNLDDFKMNLENHMKEMSKFGKFERVGYSTRFSHYMNTLAKFRPSYIKAIGLEYLYE